MLHVSSDLLILGRRLPWVCLSLSIQCFQHWFGSILVLTLSCGKMLWLSGSAFNVRKKDLWQKHRRSADNHETNISPWCEVSKFLLQAIGTRATSFLWSRWGFGMPTPRVATSLGVKPGHFRSWILKTYIDGPRCDSTTFQAVSLSEKRPGEGSFSWGPHWLGWTQKASWISSCKEWGGAKHSQIGRTLRLVFSLLQQTIGLIISFLDDEQDDDEGDDDAAAAADDDDDDEHDYTYHYYC